MLRMATAALAGAGRGVAPLPTHGARRESWATRVGAQGWARGPLREGLTHRSPEGMHAASLRRRALYRSGLAGRNVSPMRYASTPRAASRPSQIAHTTSDCPRRASPHANTPGTVVW